MAIALAAIAIASWQDIVIAIAVAIAVAPRVAPQRSLHLGTLGIHGFLGIFVDFLRYFLDFWSDFVFFGPGEVGIV